MSKKMTKDKREAFLRETRAAIISIPEDGRGPLTVPIWYHYHPNGEIHVWTGGSSRKATLLRKAERFSLCVHHDTEPYRYVSVEGPIISIEPIDLESELKPIVYRYYGKEKGDAFLLELGGDQAGTGDILVRMKPERWLTGDYS